MILYLLLVVRKKPTSNENKDWKSSFWGGQGFHGLAKTPLQTKNGTKKRRVGMTHDQKYRGGGHKIRVQWSSCTSSPENSSNKMGEEADGTDPANSTSDHADNQ